MRGIAIGLAALALAASGCSNDTTASSTPPDLSESAAYELRARAYASVCRAVLCTGSPMYAAAGDQELLDAIAEEFTDEVAPLDRDERRELTDAGGRYADGGTFIEILRVYLTSRGDVAAVDVWVDRGFLTGEGRTVLFEWNGTGWDETTPDETGITVTTAVS